MTIKQATLDGKNIAFTDCTEFFVQVGKGKSSYRTRYSFTGDLSKAVFYFNAINIGNGYKKRLVAPAFNKPLLARQFS
jgi:hypothetical protein